MNISKEGQWCLLLLTFSRDFFFIHPLHSSPAIAIIVLSLSPLCTLWTANQQRETLKPIKCNCVITCTGLGGPGWKTAWGWVTLPFLRVSQGCMVQWCGLCWGNVLERNLSGPKTEEEETPFMNMACPLVKGWVWQCAVSSPPCPQLPFSACTHTSLLEKAGHSLCSDLQEPCQGVHNLEPRVEG